MTSSRYPSIINRALASALEPATLSHGGHTTAQHERFVVKPFNTGLTSGQWKRWEAKGMTIDDILEEVEGQLA